MTETELNVQPAIARPAATLILARAAAGEPEVLLMKRSATARFMPDAFVFAGGAVESDDSSAAIYEVAAGLDDSGASRRLELATHGLAYYVAAVRETFEECGLLLAYDGTGNLVNLRSWAESDLRELRTRLGAGTTKFVDTCRDHGWRPALDRLFYFAHWITPATLPKRFDTRFFIAQAPVEQRASLASTEMAELLWITPRRALREHAAGRLLLMKATLAMMNEMSEFDALHAMLEFARRPRKIAAVLPVIAAGRGLT